jgi:hypothetical protein
MDPLQTERCQLEKEIGELSLQRDPVLSIDEAKKIIKTAESVFENGTAEDMRCLVDALISRILILSSGIKIYWKFVNYFFE